MHALPSPNQGAQRPAPYVVAALCRYINGTNLTGMVPIAWSALLGTNDKDGASNITRSGSLKEL